MIISHYIMGATLTCLGKTNILCLHSPDIHLVQHYVDGNLIAGDTLFVYGCGRCDLHGGNPERCIILLIILKKRFITTIILPGLTTLLKKTS